MRNVALQTLTPLVTPLAEARGPVTYKFPW